MEFVIEGKNMTARRAAHEEIARALDFPAYYGANLDALYDMLTAFEGTARLSGTAEMLKNLEGYGCNLLKTFYDAMEANKKFVFIAE